MIILEILTKTHTMTTGIGIMMAEIPTLVIDALFQTNNKDEIILQLETAV